MLTPEQTETIKNQLIEKVASIFPEDKQDFAIDQIKSMNSEELEDFLKKNDIALQQGTQKCIFCSIVSGDLPSYKIEENANAIAVLEINPVSKGHTLIIPKKHIHSIDNVPKSIQKFSEKISKKLKLKLNSKKVDLIFSELMGHQIINVIPVYENENINSEKSKASEEELKSLIETLSKKETKKTPPKKLTITKEKTPEKLWIPKRIP
ncbi:MAG: HIT domain-containing protein [Nanoarchaeota archaeon]|nr:HIT domain-containing protein [Nanoarchaeota archaeon]